jgi:tetratricopeptide (TPR) repeat protein
LIPPRPIILWGRILADKGEYQKALGHIQKAMSVREALLGNNHTDTAISYATMASVLLRSKKKGPRALGQMVEALSLYVRIHGNKLHLKTAQAYHSVANIQSDEHSNYHDQTLENHRRALVIR